MITLQNGSLRAEINSLGAHVDRLTFSGLAAIKESNDGHMTHGGIAPLIPYANRLKDGKYVWGDKTLNFPTGSDGNSIHGSGKDRPWKVIEQNAKSVNLGLSLYEPGYPFKVFAEMQFTLNATGFSHNIHFSNPGEVDAPLAPGFHPYFMTGSHWEVTFQRAPEKVIKMDKYFPSGNFVQFHRKLQKSSNHTYDDCFKYRGTVEIGGDDLDFTLTSSEANYIMVYDGEFSQNCSVAVEPMSSGINAFNTMNDIKILKPKEAWDFGYNVEIMMK